MKEIWKHSISEFKEFTRAGYHYTKISDKDNTYLFHLDGSSGYELMIGKKAKQPDGSVVYVKPGDEDFGTYGWYLCGSLNNIYIALDRIKTKHPEIDTDYFKECIRIDMMKNR